MSAFLSFAAGFAMRPIGALVLGPYIDRIGRRKGLIVTLAIMACGTVLIAFVPGYATIGLAAPLLVVIGPAVAGLFGRRRTRRRFRLPLRNGAAGTEGILRQLAIGEPAGRHRRRRADRLRHRQAMAPADVAAWGWRIPFVIGCLIVPLLFVLRASLQETEEFLARVHHPSFAEIARTLTRQLDSGPRRRSAWW